MENDKTFYSKIIADAEDIILVREQDGAEAAFGLWHDLEHKTAGRRNSLPDAISSLLIELEFLVEDDPSADVSEVRHANYVARAWLKKERGRGR